MATQNFAVPKYLQEHYNTIVKITDEFCQKYLNDEYAQLCRKMAAALARKRPSPFLTGYIDIWAAGIIYTAGSNNFLFDKSLQPYMPLQEVCEKLGVSQSTISQKSTVIRRLLKIHHADPNWALPSRLEDSEIFWVIQVNGIFIDARECPREIQETAYKKGLIPYIPEKHM